MRSFGWVLIFLGIAMAAALLFGSDIFHQFSLPLKETYWWSISFRSDVASQLRVSAIIVCVFPVLLVLTGALVLLVPLPQKS